MPEDSFEKIREQLKNLVEGNEEKLKNYYEGKSYIDFLFENIKSITQSFKDKDQLIEFVKQLIPFYFQHYDKLLINNPLVDKELFEQIQILFEKANQINPTGFIEITSPYLEDFETKYPIEQFSWTLLLYQKNYEAIFEIFKSTSILETAEKFESFLYDLVEKHQENQFKLYFFDWVLKFGYLIEGYIKPILLCQVKLNYLLSGKKFKRRYSTIGWLLRNLGEDRILSFYRNAIFHSTFLLDYKVHLDEKKVIFFGKYSRNKEVSTRKFIEGFFTLIQVVHTFLISLFVFLYYLNKDKILTEVLKNLEMFLSAIEEVDFTYEQLSELDIEEFLKDLKEAMRRGVF